MAQEYPGFLTENQRKYLTGEKDLSDHSNPSQVKRRIRERINGAQRDMALLNSKFNENELKSAYRPNSGQLAASAQIPDEILNTTIASIRGQATGVGAGEFVDLVEGALTAPDNADVDAGEMEIEEFLVRSVVEVLRSLWAIDGPTTEDQTQLILDFIEFSWPDRAEAVDIAEEQLLED